MDDMNAPLRRQVEQPNGVPLMLTSEFTTPVEHVSEKQGPINLKRTRPQSPNSHFVENAASATLNISDVPDMAGHPVRNVRRKQCGTGERKLQQAKQASYRECYVSLSQKEARDMCSIRFPLVAKRCSAGDGQSLPLLVKAMQPVLCERGTINIHTSLEEETIFTVTDEHDAYLTYDILTAAEHAMVAGTKINFRQWKPTDEFGFDVAEQRVHVSISSLPLQLWSPATVEHIPSPYCALEFVTGGTRHRANLQSYKCIAWAQNKILVPNSILLCIPITIPDEGQLMETHPYRRVLVYRINLELQHYIHHGAMEVTRYTLVAHVPRYEQGYTTSNAICYMPPHLVDKEFMQQLSNSIITTCTPECVQTMCDELHLLYPDIAIDIKPLNHTQQIILLPPGKTGSLMQQKFLSKSIPGMSDIQPWSATAVSMEELLHVCARVTISRVPAHFCTSKLIHLFLGGYAYMEIPDNNAEKLVTCEMYHCIVWCHDAASIPQNMLAKAVSADIASALLLHSDPGVTLRTSKMQIEIQHTASSIQALVDL